MTQKWDTWKFLLPIGKHPKEMTAKADSMSPDLVSSRFLLGVGFPAARWT